MSVTNKIKALLSLFDKKQGELMEILDMSSKQSLSNKFANERWSANDLISIAEFTGCKLAFVLPDGQHLFIDADDKEEQSK